MKINNKSSEWLLLAVGLLSRLPFIWEGYGREEDAWGQALNAQLISETGVYELSRLPGHPIYELLLAGLWNFNHSYAFFNGLSALASAFTLVFFYRILTHLKIDKALLLALTLNFVPVFFVAGTYTIDYNFALLFILASLHYLLQGRVWMSGMLLGIATGFRISSLGFALPWIILSYKQLGLNGIIRLCLSSGLIAILSFTPAFSVYGMGFLDFHKPPFPSLTKVMYKLSFGIWGIPLLIFLAYIIVNKLRKFAVDRKARTPMPYFITAMWIVILMQLVVFIRLPFKSEFFIPAIPFILIALSQFMKAGEIRMLFIASVISCFAFGFDYNNPYRGASPSGLALTFEAGGKNIFMDPIQGPAVIDNQKRKNRSIFIEQILEWDRKRGQEAHVIAGWHWPEIMLKKDDSNYSHFDYYSTEEELWEAVDNGQEIFYLPELNEVNVDIHHHYLADTLGTVLIP